MMHIYYRISDKGNPKEKLDHADKISCLKNAIREFGSESFNIIADNCTAETIGGIRTLGLSIEETSLGNSASFMHMLDRILAERSDDELVYLLEDDYLHLPGSRIALEEAFAIGDYVTLYDHPDKYKLDKDGGNPLNWKGMHTTKVYVTNTSHWRETDSTTMTFACRVGTLRADYDVWKRYTHSRNPDDFHGFMTLSQKSLMDAIAFLVRRRKKECKLILLNWILGRKMRIVLSAIPAKATHAEIAWLAPVVDWKKRLS
jgi:hypothetical protein